MKSNGRIYFLVIICFFLYHLHYKSDKKDQYTVSYKVLSSLLELLFKAQISLQKFKQTSDFIRKQCWDVGSKVLFVTQLI